MDQHGPPISFDEEGRIRVLPPAKFQATEELETQAREFVAKIQQFSEIVHSLVEVLNAQAASIERAKLKAIGQRNLLESERENRRRRQAQIQALIDEKRAEYDRLQAQYESLRKVENEQREILAKLTDSDTV